MYKKVNGELIPLAIPQKIEVEKIRSGVLSNPMASKHKEYFNSIAELTSQVNTYQFDFNKANTRLKAYERNLSYLKKNNAELTKKVYDLMAAMNTLNAALYGSKAKQQIGEKTEPSINSFLWKARGTSNSYGPTQLHMESFDIAKTMFGDIQPKLDSYFEQIKALGILMEEAGAPAILD